MNYHHLTIEERSCIRKYYVDGLSYREIARLIGRDVSTVSREIRRNCTHMYDIPTYYPHTAQKKYLLRRSYCHRGMFHSQEVIDYIEEKLRATWSPEQIACTPCELKMPSWRTIYRWIYEKYLVNGNLKVLRRKGKSHGVKETRGKYSKGKSIRKRDKTVYSRQEAGHWEADTVVSGQGKSKACFATLAERKTRFYIAVKMPDRRAETMENAIVAALSAFPPQLVKTITCDRGTEFANWRRIEERLHCEVYFADPYCAWQKGTNENLNGLLREFYPKGRNLSRVAPATLKRNLALINARPRKVLNFRSAQKLWSSSSTPVALSLTIHCLFLRLFGIFLPAPSGRKPRRGQEQQSGRSQKRQSQPIREILQKAAQKCCGNDQHGGCAPHQKRQFFFHRLPSPLAAPSAADRSAFRRARRS